MTPSFLRFGFLLALGSASLQPVRAQGNDSASPFLPASTALGAAPAEDADCELVGIISMSKHTMIGINEKTVHRSLWIPVGKTVDGVEVISCDPSRDQATVRIGGQTKTLVMRSAPTNVIPSTNMSAYNNSGTLATRVESKPFPVAPISTPVTEQSQKETEARMLVSDLMEIGMQQRKAYEEAQRNAAAQKKAVSQ